MFILFLYISIHFKKYISIINSFVIEKFEFSIFNSIFYLSLNIFTLFRCIYFKKYYLWIWHNLCWTPCIHKPVIESHKVEEAPFGRSGEQESFEGRGYTFMSTAKQLWSIWVRENRRWYICWTPAISPRMRDSFAVSQPIWIFNW